MGDDIICSIGFRKRPREINCAFKQKRQLNLLTFCGQVLLYLDLYVGDNLLQQTEETLASNGDIWKEAWSVWVFKIARAIHL